MSSLALGLILLCVAQESPESELAGYVARFHRDGDRNSAAYTSWLYDRTVWTWGEGADAWLTEESFDAVVDELHEYRRARGLDAAPFARADYNASYAFELGERFAEGRRHLERTVELYPPGTANRGQLLLVLATWARLCRNYDANRGLLDRVEEDLALAPAGATTIEGRVMLHLERAHYASVVGLTDQGPAELQAARELLDAHAAELSAFEQEGKPLDLELQLRSDHLHESLNLAVAFDDHERVLDLLERARAEPWYERVDPWSLLEHEVERALALLDRQRSDPAVREEARSAIRSLLDADLEPDDLLTCLLSLAELETEAGAHDEAQALLAAARERLADSRSWCSSDLPRSHEIDLLAHEARLASRMTREPGVLRAHLDRVRPALDAMIRRWSDAPLHDGGLAIAQTNDRMRVAEVVIDLTLGALGPERGAREALFEVARVQAVGSLARELGALPPDVESVLALAPASGGFLVFVPGSHDSFVFAVDPSVVTAHRLPPVREWQELRRDVVIEVARAVRGGRMTDSLREACFELDRALFPQELALRIAAWREIAFVGVDGIGYVPFELLHAGGGEPLGRRAAISYVPSLPLAVWLAHERPLPAAERLARGRLRLVTTSDAAGTRPRRLPQLPFGAAETRRLFGDSVPRVDLASVDEATPSGLRALDLAAALGVHVVAHTVDTGRSDRPRALLLNPDASGEDVLAPDGIERLAAPLLVYLTACGASQGPLRPGDDGRHHLGGAFFLAGARTIVLSYADVSFQAAIDHGAGFYEAFLERGLSPAEAMLEARRATDEDALHPYLVHVVGLGHERWLPAVDDERAIPWNWILAGAVLGFILLALRRRVRSP